MPDRKIFVGSKKDIEAARKKGVKVSAVERVPGTALGQLFTRPQQGAIFVPKHQAIPCVVKVANASGTFVCHEIDSHSMARGIRFRDAVNLGSGTPVAGDKVLVNADSQGAPVFFFNGADFDVVKADGICTVKLASPNTAFNNTFRAIASNGSVSGFSSDEEIFIEFTTAVDASGLSAQSNNLFRLLIPFDVNEKYDFDGDEDATIEPKHALNVDLITTSFDCSTLTWNTKPGGTFITKHITPQSASVLAGGIGCDAPGPFVDTYLFQFERSADGVDISQGTESSTIFGYRLYWSDDTISTPTGVWTLDTEYTGGGVGGQFPALVSIPPAGQFG